MKTVLLSFVGLLMTMLSYGQKRGVHEMSPTTILDNGKTARVCFDVAGLGNVSETQLTVTYSYAATVECANPAGNVAPGQTKMYTGVKETFTVAVSNGRAADCVNIGELIKPDPNSCPNGKWTPSITDVTFSNVSITVAGRTFAAR